MKVGIDASTWTNRRGYGRFTRELVKAMVESYPEHEFVLVVDAATAAEGEFPERATLEVVATSEQQIQAASAEGSRQIADLWRMARAPPGPVSLATVVIKWTSKMARSRITP